ncbi:23S rRNA (guanosine-2'-O-)-methyltransferase RlmB [Kordia antarctica]|uniref:23S rRNA (Guanosine-2'-O-)-methyltransferase RlmB n=1 Tax=Kordia antarctica TaxID=1218801 RepID=A0A7L4ZPU1_9FLAO|nr:RNA methyltransferase [Kordia antarctica]QHI38499.1 23S rRNA (guanosine-2'-O-)-methyltransferase RlmB [Kordia antarctica]
MVSKRQIKIITSLHQKKYRKSIGLFVAEGKKVIDEFLNSHFELDSLFTTDENLFAVHPKVTVISEAELKKISFLKTPNKALALFKISDDKIASAEGFIVALDDVRDPGNLGTIIRLCDWFGVKQLVCSEATVDCYNPKVIQATMGSLTRVNVVYTDLGKYLAEAKLPVFGAFMDGDNVYKTKLPKDGILVMGNEANGVSEEVSKLITQKISIPRFGEIQATESLNVATATGILLNEFKRSLFL